MFPERVFSGSFVEMTGHIKVEDFAESAKVEEILSGDYCLKELKIRLIGVSRKRNLVIKHNSIPAHKCNKKLGIF